jgi:hypothetical protein
LRCDEVRTELVALDRGELDPAAAEAVRAHLAQCAACAEEARRLRRATELVAAATTFSPNDGTTARLLAAVDSALVAEREALSRRGTFRVLWDRARDRYEQSATVRRFAVASIAVHAAAVAFVAFVLAQDAGAPGRETSIASRVDPPTPEFPGETRAASALAAFEPATFEGVAGPGGRRFPNRGTADRVGGLFDPAARRAALREAVGDAAPAVEEALREALEELAARQAPDGSFPDSELGATGTVETSALAVLAFASSGGESVASLTSGRGAAYLESVIAPGPKGDAAWTDEDDAAYIARARAVEALAFRYGTAFADLSPAQRADAARPLRDAAGRLAKGCGPDGATGSVDAAIASARALLAVRDAGIADTADGLVAAAERLDAARATDGRLLGPDRAATVARTAALAELGPRLGMARVSEGFAARLAGQVAGLAKSHPDVALAGVGALRSRDLPLRGTAEAVVAAAPQGGSVRDRAVRAAALARTLRR